MAKQHTITIPPGLATSMQRLDAFSTYPPDWDDAGAAPIAPDTILRAKRLMRDIFTSAPQGEAEPFYIGPIPNGGIQVEWRGSADSIEVEIRPNGTYGCLSVRASASEPKITYQRDISIDEIIARSYAVGGNFSWW